MTDQTSAPVPVETGLSLQERIARRERELAREPERAIILRVPWLGDFLSVQYRALDYREMFSLESRHEKRKDEYEKNLFAGADKLINACEGILERVDSDTYKETGYTWGATAARELFGRELLPEATARDGILAIFREDELLFDHLAEYEEQRKAVRVGLERRLEGESKASSVGT